MKKIYLIALFLLSVLHYSCEKDEFTIPVDVDFVVSMEFDSELNYLQFNTGVIAVENITFQGERQEGEDVYFTSKPDEVFGPITFSTEGSEYVTHFDIPQGEYILMDWGFTLSLIGEEDEPEKMDGSIFELEQPEPGLLFEGIFKPISGVEIPLIISIEDEEKIFVHAENEEETLLVSLLEENLYQANLIFDLGAAFQSISIESLANAVLTEKNEILISNNSNEELYELLLYRLEKSARVVFSIK